MPKVSSNRDDMAMGGSQWNQWYPAETEILIKNWGEAVASGELDGTMRNQFVHMDIAKKLAEAGFNRTTSGIQNRIKYLKRTYAKARKLVQSGQGRMVRHRPQYYKELDRILGDDPFWGTHPGGHGESSGDNPKAAEHETSEGAGSSNPTLRGGFVSSDTISPRETDDYDNFVSVDVHTSDKEEEDDDDDKPRSATGETVIIKEEPDVDYEMIDKEPIFRTTTTTINPQQRSSSPLLTSQASRNANEMHMPVIESVYGATTMPTSLTTTTAGGSSKEQELAELKAKLVTEQHRAKMALIKLKQDAARAKLESARAKRSAYDEKRMFYFEKRKMLHSEVDQM